MFGDGISLIDLTALLKAVRDKQLIVQVKILDGNWEDLSVSQIKKMISTITTGGIKNGNDIRLRVSDKHTSIHP